ncbi:hypothetical protein ACJBUB_10800, partial [Streptococcus suis]
HRMEFGPSSWPFLHINSESVCWSQTMLATGLLRYKNLRQYSRQARAKPLFLILSYQILCLA